MKYIKLMTLVLAMLFFTACGSDSTDETTVEDVQTVEEISQSGTLTDLLKAKEFYVIEDSIQTKNMYKMSFDENLSSWEIEIYDGNYSAGASNTVTNNIAVTETTLINDGGLMYELRDTSSNYIDLVSTSSDLIALRMFTTAQEAQDYYNISLVDMVKNKEYFVVQNDLSVRTLFKITFNEDATTWDILSYEPDFQDESITGTAAGMNIAVTDNNLTDSGGATFWLSSVNDNNFRLVAYGNSLVTLDFYETSEEALSYYNLFDLRTELKGKTFYAVGDNSTDKQLIKFTFDDNLSRWAFELFTTDYNETATTSGENNISVTQDRVIEEGADTLRYISNNDDYIELQSLSNSLSTYRLYNSSTTAQTYFEQ